MSVTPHYNKQIQKPIGPPELPDLFYCPAGFIGWESRWEEVGGANWNGR